MKSNYRNIIALSILLVMVLSSCRDVLFDEEIKSEDPQVNFDYLWEQCLEKYAFFELKGIDWQEVREEYEPKIFDGMSQDSLFRVLGAMLNELEDGHVNLFSFFDVSFFPFRQRGQDNFDWRIIEDNYLPEDYYRTGPFRHEFITEDIGYVRYASFQSPFSNLNLDFVLSYYRNSKGIILDLRENGGGSASRIYRILDRFIERDTDLFQHRHKTGAGAEDFSALETTTLSPHDGIRYSGFVVVLTDRGTYSASSIFSLGSRAIPKMTLLGDTTGGGLGGPAGGQLPNAWSYRFSVTQTLDMQGNNYENGVPVDIRQDVDWSDRSRDEILDRAVAFIQSQ